MKYLFPFLFLLLSPQIVYAHDEMAGSGVLDQVNELLPIAHISEGHWVAVLLSFVLWYALCYTIYRGIRKILARKTAPKINSPIQQ